MAAPTAREKGGARRRAEQGRSGQRARTGGDLVEEQRAGAPERERRSEAEGGRRILVCVVGWR